MYTYCRSEILLKGFRPTELGINFNALVCEEEQDAAMRPTVSLSYVQPFFNYQQNIANDLYSAYIITEL